MKHHGISILNFSLGFSFACLTFAVVAYYDPMISAHLWCAISNSARCF